MAWNPLGWEAIAFSEIDPFPSAVLTHYYPSVPNWGDMERYKEWPDATVDLLVGGTPCQSFSVSGFRKGLEDPRGNLALVYLGVAARYRPRWIVWENVPGVLSSNGGRDFGSFVGGLVELGYGFAYRVLDAQFFGVPQRRRRVFVVGYFGDWRRAAEVLFEPSSLRRHSAPRREAGKDVAPSLASRTRGSGGLGTDAELDGALIAFGGNNTSGPIEVATACNAHSGRQDFESETFITHSLCAEGFDASEDGTGRGTPLVPIPFDTTQITSALNRNNPKPGDPSHPLAAGAHAPAIAFHNRQDPDISGDVTHPLGAKDNGMGVATRAAVRRLTPRECERLQGFPDDYTLIPYRRKPAKDGPRYKALGNTMAIPSMRWLGKRINESEEIRK